MKMKKLVSLFIAMVMVISVLPFEAFKVLADAFAPTEYSVEVGNVRVQLLSDTLARVEVKGKNGNYEDRKTYHVVGRDWDGIESQVVAEGSMTKIITKNYTVHVPSNANSLDGIFITGSNGRQIWKYTSLPSAQVFLPEPGDVPNAWEIADNPRVVPAEWGYSPMPEDQEDNGYNGWDADDQSPDMYVFMPQGSYRRLLKDFIKLTGEQELVTLKSLGLWHSRYHPYNEEDVKRIVGEYRENGFPLDQMVIDTDWRQIEDGHFGGSGYEINRDLFPHMEELLTELNEKYHVNTMFNDHPEPVKVDGEEQHALTQADLQFRNKNLKKILGINMNNWWYDRNWGTTIISPFNGIPKESFGMYLYQEIAKAYNSEARPMIMGNVDGIDNGAFRRAPNLASHRFTLQWTGDTWNTPNDLKREIEDVVHAGATTANAFISTDVGGHNGYDTPEQWSRWTQFAAFSPFFRYHCTSAGYGANDRAPYLYGDAAKAMAQEYIAMRYRLLPVLYSVSHENYETGLPITRRLDYNYPNYAQAKNDTQYLLGDHILVAPLWEGGGTPSAAPKAWFSMDAEGTKPGLTAKYYNNEALEGEPALERDDEDINFDWGTGSPKEGTINEDHFSASWNGYITIGAEDSKLAINCDDGVRLYIDDELILDKWKPNNNVTYTTEEIFQAGTTHKITLEYYEGEGNAFVKLMYLAADAESNGRSVFIPDGRWIDVWTGREYEGPQTIEVTHGLDTSPLFVRSGTILPLVDNVEYIGEKKWDAMTLDVYPSTQLDGSFELYEDDGTSVGYKDGKYRSTDLKTSFDSATGEILVDVGKAEGSFEGSDAFNSRAWTVRVHMPKSWGSLEGVTVDGNSTTNYQYYAQADRSETSPFALKGQASDGDIYEITFDKPLDASSEVRMKMSSPQDEKIPDYKEIPVDMEVKNKFFGNRVDLTKEGKDDWAHFGASEGNAVITRKADGGSLIKDVTVNGSAEAYEGAASYEWSDAQGGKAGSSNKGLSVHDGSIEVEIGVGTKDKRIQLFVGGEDASGRVEISDGTNQSAKVVELSALKGKYKNKLELLASADEETTIKVKYIKTEGEGSIALYGAAVSEPTDNSKEEVTRFAFMENAPDSVNLSDEKNIDWVHVGLGQDPSAINRKAGVEQFLSDPMAEGDTREVHDYHSHISFSDGYPTQSVDDCQNAIACPGTLQISVPSTDEWRELKLYFGVWKGTNTVEIFDETGNEVSSYEFKAGSDANTRVLNVQFKSETESTLFVKWSQTGGDSSGNVSLAAYSLSEPGTNTDGIQASLQEVPDKLNLSEDKFVEWGHFGYRDADNFNKKVNASTAMIGQPRTLIDPLLLATDYKTAFSWKDGDKDPNVQDTRHFTHSFNAMELDLDAEPGSWMIDVYTSVWWGRGYVELVDETGAVIDTFMYEQQSDASAYRKLSLACDLEEAQKLTVRVMPSYANDGHGGNMSIVAATVEDKNAVSLDTTQLEAALKNAEAITDKIVPAAVAQDLQDAIDEAKELLEAVGSEKRADITQDMIDKAADQLKELVQLIENLPVRKTLHDWIEKAKELDGKEAYQNADPAVQAAFDEALQDAVRIFEAVTSTQAQVNTAAWNMMESIYDLGIFPGNREILKELVERYSDPNFLSQYEDNEEKEALAKRCEDARVIIDDEDATQNAIEDMIQKLEEAKDKLTKKDPELDYSGLLETIREAKALKENLDSYVEANQAAFLETLEEAEALIGKALTQQNIRDMQTKLSGAMSSLLKKAKKEALQGLLNAYKDLDLSVYTEESVAVFRAAFSNAQSVLEDESLSEKDQNVVDRAYAELEQAYQALKSGVVDKGFLEKKIQHAEALHAEAYTKKSWAALEAALKAAKAVLADEAADQDAVDKAYADLSNAIAQLKEKEAENPTPTPQEKESDTHKGDRDTKGGSGGSGKSAGTAKTGDPQKPMIFVALIVLSGLSFVVLKKKQGK